MKETFYFSHDYNARSDVKIKRLIAKHGLLGYGIYWAIIEDLYQNANALPLDCESIAFDLRTHEDIIKSIINDFDLFVIEDKEFGSLSVQRRLDERAERSTKAKESANKRWGKNANAMRTHSEGNAIKERKVKEIKESNFYFDDESKTPNQLYEMKLDNYIYDNPKNKNQADYTKDELELIINNKKKSLAIWCEIHSLSERNEKQKIEFIQALNKQLYLLGFNGFCDFLRQLKHYFLTQKRENYKYIVKLPKLIDTVNEKDWKVYWTKTATEEELDPEPYLPPQPDVDLDSQEFKDWEKEASVHGEWRKRQAAKMFKAGL